LKEDSSFSEEKEAKRLSSVWVCTMLLPYTAYPNRQKFFASFLQKRRPSFLSMPRT
jgi:hypothetical protein